MTTEIKVLDKGFVRLVSSMGDDKAIVNSARVSYRGFTGDSVLTDADKKLIRSLIQRKHTSPFECVNFTFAVKAPIFVVRQWQRHRTWKYNEVSARYKQLPNDFYVPHPDMIGSQMKHEKQMRDLEGGNSHAAEIAQCITLHNDMCYKEYSDLMDLGCPRELARMVLPSNIYTEMFATVDLHNLTHFLRLRCDKHAQHEIQVYAYAMLDLIEEVVPFTAAIIADQLIEEGVINVG